MIKQIIVALLIIIIGMGLGGGGWYAWNKYMAPPVQPVDDSEEIEQEQLQTRTQLGREEPGANFDVPVQQTRIPVAVLPRYVPGAEETEILARQLSDRQQSLELRDDRLLQKEAAMKLILEDFQAEQDLISKLRVAVDTELQQASRDTISQTQAAADNAEADANAAAAGGLGGPALAADEQANIRKLGLAYDTMPADAAATIFMEMDKEGLQDTVVRLLAAMKERSSARVLAEISNTDAELAAQLTQELREMKTQQPAVAP